MSDAPKCAAVVYRRDTYRVARGTKSGFRMHYDRSRCRRLALAGGKLCAQHQAAADVGGYLATWAED